MLNKVEVPQISDHNSLSRGTWDIRYSTGEKITIYNLFLN